MSDQNARTHEMAIPLLPVSNANAVVTAEMVTKLIDETDDEDLEQAIRMAAGRSGYRPDKSSE